MQARAGVCPATARRPHLLNSSTVRMSDSQIVAVSNFDLRFRPWQEASISARISVLCSRGSARRLVGGEPRQINRVAVDHDLAHARPGSMRWMVIEFSCAWFGLSPLPP